MCQYLKSLLSISFSVTNQTPSISTKNELDWTEVVDSTKHYPGNILHNVLALNV